MLMRRVCSYLCWHVSRNAPLKVLQKFAWDKPSSGLRILLVKTCVQLCTLNGILCKSAQPGYAFAFHLTSFEVLYYFVFIL
jgi:hypothetical protein